MWIYEKKSIVFSLLYTGSNLLYINEKSSYISISNYINKIVTINKIIQHMVYCLGENNIFNENCAVIGILSSDFFECVYIILIIIAINIILL